MGALLLIVLGTLITLGGLAAIGPQVQVHKINPQSKAAWVFRLGAGVLILGQLVGLLFAVEAVAGTISLIIGLAVLFAGLAIFSHERQQAEFRFARSLSIQIFGLGGLITILALIINL